MSIPLDISEEEIKNLIYSECKALELHAKKYSDSVLSGAYKSVKRGSGIEFEETRVYSPSDDARRIDWKVTARKQKPYIKSFREEREQSIFLIVDSTYSTLLGKENTKSKKILEVAAFIGSIASFNQDKIGSMSFTNSDVSFNKAKRGFSSVYKILHDIISLSLRIGSIEESKSNASHISFKAVLDHVQRFIKKRSKVFLISDFSFVNDFEKELSTLSKKQDIYCISVYDAIEDSLPTSGTYLTKNPETGEEHILSLSHPQVRDYLQTQIKVHREQIEQIFKKREIPFIALHTSTDTREALFRFFKRS